MEQRGDRGLIRILVHSEDRNTAGLLAASIERFFCNNNTKYKILISLEAANALNYAKKSDIAFVDIDMHGGGLDLLSGMKQANPRILLIVAAETAQDLDDAIKVGVLGYLPKPLSSRKIHKDLEYALREHYRRPQSVVATSERRTLRIPIHEIVYVTTENRKTRVRTLRDSLLCDETLTQWQEMLAGQHFTLSHTSFLVNLEHVAGFDKTRVAVRLPGGQTETVHMSQRKYYAFKEAFLEFSKSAP